tara:strand:+ start:207 stop:1148 length:942 start_codon:yes stop_codon:yes gene_type:complete
MKWESLGLIFNPKKYLKWVKSHAWVPTPIVIKKDKVRVFFAGRDKENHSNIGFFDVSLKNPKKIIKVSNQPILKKGRLGCFDDSAAIPSYITKINKKYFLYYVGWTRGITVPYISSIGLAVSNNLNGKFKRISESPIIGKSKFDPIFTASCFVEKKDKKFKMIYTSNRSWKNDKFFIPNYNIKYAYSKNGIDWKVTNKFLLKKNTEKEIAITRPWLLNEKNKKLLFYSYKNYKNKGRNYKIGFASREQNLWKRKDSNLQIENKKDTFDKSMQEYASIIKYKDFYYMFYNGNNYGENGIGLAKINKTEIMKYMY